MSDQVLNQVMESLGPYRMQASQIRLSTQTLGRGAFGDVKLGEVGGSRWTQKPSKQVAVKQLRANADMNIEEKRKLVIEFAREVRVWAGLDDPHIVPLIGFCLDEIMDRAWLISPYLKNGNARQYLDRLKPDLRTRLLMLGETADGLVYLQGLKIRHGDIKSGNVLIDDQGHAKLCDFGIAKYMEGGKSGLTTSNGLKGSIRFMAPELFEEEHPHGTIKSDNWAWCCLAIEILLDKVPYDDAPTNSVVIGRIIKGVLPTQIDKLEIPDCIKAIFVRCWVPQPDDRLEMALCSEGVAEALSQIPDEHHSVPSSEQSLQHVPVDSPSSPTAVDESSGTISRGFGRILRGIITGNGLQEFATANEAKTSEADKTISRQRQTLHRRPEGHARRHVVLNKLAISLRERYLENGDMADLNEAIDFHRQAFLLWPTGNSGRYWGLHHFALSVREKYLKDGEVSDLNESIDVFRQALLLRPLGHSERYWSLHHIALLLRENYVMDGEVADLNEAIDLLGQALVLRSLGHPERYWSLHHLALLMQEKYLKDGEVSDRNEAIDLFRQALLLRPGGHSERYWSLHHLALLMREKYLKYGDVTDLNMTIDLHRQALLLRPEGHSERHWSLHNLALSVRDMYLKDGDVADMNEAIDLDRQALLLRPVGHQERHNSLENLANLAQDMYHKEGDSVYLDEATDLRQQALSALPAGHPQRRSNQHLSMRFWTSD